MTKKKAFNYFESFFVPGAGIEPARDYPIGF